MLGRQHIYLEILDILSSQALIYSLVGQQPFDSFTDMLRFQSYFICSALYVEFGIEQDSINARAKARSHQNRIFLQGQEYLR